MIKVSNVIKEFVSSKKYPGLKGAIEGLFSVEKEITKAVNDISFEINDGEMVGYIGENGAGKSTSIKMMTGIIEPTSGIIEVDGIIPYIKRRENAKNIGVVFGQRTQLWWNLPLCESFVILKEIYNVSDKDYKDRMSFLNETLGIEQFDRKSVRNLSLGQRMRADLAASLLHNPKTLFLDEPTIGLDVVVKDKIRKAIKEINSNYNTKIILTTHDLGDIEEICNRIMIIDKGSIIYDGTIDDIKNKYGKKRHVSMDLKDIDIVNQLELNKKYCLSKEVFDFFIEGKTVTYLFDKNKLNVSTLISDVMSNTEINDVRIKETSIGEIVRQIYTNGIEVR